MEDTYRSPNDIIGNPGQPALGIAGQAAVQDEAHNKWHEDNPGQMCNPSDWPDNYGDVARGDQVMNSIAGTFEAGESFISGKEK